MLVEWLAPLKYVAKPVWDWFLGNQKARRERDADLSRVYLELRDILDQAVEALRVLADEHNRRNDPEIRRNRSWASYGPAASPPSIAFHVVPEILQRRYEVFTQAQRSAIKEVFGFVEEYNGLIQSLRLAEKLTYQELEWDFVVRPLGTLASMAYLIAKLCELKERFQLDDSVSAADAMHKVFDSYRIRAFGVEFTDCQ